MASQRMNSAPCAPASRTSSWIEYSVSDFRLVHDLVQAHQVEFLVDEAGALAIELMGHAAGAQHDDLQILGVRLDRAADAPGRA